MRTMLQRELDEAAAAGKHQVGRPVDAHVGARSDTAPRARGARGARLCSTSGKDSNGVAIGQMVRQERPRCIHDAPAEEDLAHDRDVEAEGGGAGAPMDTSPSGPWAFCQGTPQSGDDSGTDAMDMS